MKKYLKRFLSLGAAAVLAAALAGCSDSLSEDENGTAAEETAAVENSTSYGKATASLFVPDYAALVGKAKASSSARAVAPQTSKVVLTYGSDTDKKVAGSVTLSSATKTDATNASGVAGTAYTFSFTLPAGTYAAGDIVISLYDSSNALLSSGTNAVETTIEADKETTESVTLVPNASDDNMSGSLAAGEMKFVKVTVGTDNDVVLTTSGGVSLFLFDSTGKLVNNTTYTAPLTLESDSATLTKGDAETDYYVGIYSATAVESYTVTVSGAAAETSYTVVYGETTLTLTESELETYKTTYGLTENDDYTVSDTTVTLTESGYKKVNLLVSATMPTGNWGVKSESSDTINVATNVTANGDFNAAYMNYYFVNGAYAGMSYTSTPSAYVSIAAAAFADVSSTSVELVIQQAYSNSSSCNPQIAVSNGTKILALSSVLDSQSKNDITFYLNPSDLTTNGLMIFTVDNTAPKSSSWSFSGLAAYKSDTALDTTAPEAATGFTATAATEAAELSWTASTSTDVTAYILSYKTGEEAAKTAVLASSATSKTVDSLTAGSEYTFTLTAVDVYGNVSSEASASATPTENTKTWADVAAENFTWTTAKANTDSLSYSGTAGTWQNMIIDATSSYEWTTGTATPSAFRTHDSTYFKVNANKYIVLYIPMTKDGTITLTGDSNSSGFAVYGGALPAAIEDTDTTTAITASSNVWTYNYKTSEGVSGSSISITSGSDTISGESDGTYAVITIVNTTTAAGNSYLKDIARTYSSN